MPRAVKKGPRLRRWTWPDGVFDVTVVLLRGEWAPTKVWMEKTFKDCADLSEGRAAKTLWVPRDRGTALVLWFPRWFNAEDSDCLGVLAHECFHAAEFVLRERGCSLVVNASDEAYAYYIAWMFRECHKRLSQ